MAAFGIALLEGRLKTHLFVPVIQVATVLNFTLTLVRAVLDCTLVIAVLKFIRTIAVLKFIRTVALLKFIRTIVLLKFIRAIAVLSFTLILAIVVVIVRALTAWRDPIPVCTASSAE